MKVLQLIDSLEAGGAERIAVTYANSLSKHIDSYLCATRAEGVLLDTILEEVNYVFLEKKKSIDIKAILKLKKYIKNNQIAIIHAHSSSFFLAGLMKLFNYKLKIIWHDHYGKSDDLIDRPYRILKLFSFLFTTIIVVNSKLKNWALTNLYCNNVVFMSNFISDFPDSKQETTLKGKKGKRIVCLANLREQKDHINLLNSFLKIKESYPEWTLHLVGKDFNDVYSRSIFQFIKTNKLEHSVFNYGSCSDISHILSQSTIGVLSSKSEGLPVALLEYGFASLPTVVTNVGDCSTVIHHEQNGLLVPPKNPISIYNAVCKLIINQNLSYKLAKQLHQDIINNYIASSSIYKVLKIYEA
tara:strand:- start:704 stop:1771 length:1068 start_codon:yes stop_codon:yes gene_type:complete